MTQQHKIYIWHRNIVHKKKQRNIVHTQDTETLYSHMTQKHCTHTLHRSIVQTHETEILYTHMTQNIKHKIETHIGKETTYYIGLKDKTVK